MSDEQPKETSESSPGDRQDLPAVTVEGELQAITAERDKLAAEKAEMYDRLLRKQAEFEISGTLGAGPVGLPAVRGDGSRPRAAADAG